MKKNEVETTVQQVQPAPETTVAQSTEAAVTPQQVTPVAPEAPTQPVVTEIATPTVSPEAPTQPVVTEIATPTVSPEASAIVAPAPVQTTAPIVNGSGSPNGFANLLAKVKSFGVGPIVTIAIVAVVLVGGIVFTTISSSPKAVFKGAINKVYKVSNTAIDGYEKYLKEYDLTENPAHVTGDFAIDTNIDDLKENGVNKTSLNFDAGLDFKNEVLSLGAELKGSKEKITLDTQYISDEMYVKSSLFEEVVKLDSEMLSELGVYIDFEELKQELETIKKEYNTDPETYEYLLKTIKNALVKTLNNEYMEKEKDEIEVLDKEIKVTKHSYIFDEDAVQEMVKVITEYLLDEEDFDKTLADAIGVKTSEVKSVLKQLKKSAKDIEFEEEIAINIYTKGLFNTIVGFGVEVENKEYISIYTDGKNVEITFDNHEDDDYSAEKIVMTIEENGKGYKAEVTHNKEKILEMDIKEATEETIDMEVTAYEEGEKVANVNIYLSMKQEKDAFSGEYKFKVTETEEEQYMEFSGKYAINIKEKIEKMSGTKDAVSIEELDIDQVTDNVEKITEEDKELGALIEETLITIEDEMTDLNYIGMSEVSVSEAESLLTKNKATVLYIGETYYPSTTRSDAYSFLSNIQSLQYELDFYSYFLDDIYVTSDFEKILGQQITNCIQLPANEEKESSEEMPVVSEETAPEEDIQDTTTNCIPSAPNYPALYLIKDGKIQKTLNSKATYEEIKNALAEIGIE